MAQVPALAQQALGSADFDQAWAEGQSLSLDEAITEALLIEPAPATAEPLRRAEQRSQRGRLSRA